MSFADIPQLGSIAGVRLASGLTTASRRTERGRLPTGRENDHDPKRDHFEDACGKTLLANDASLNSGFGSVLNFRTLPGFQCSRPSAYGPV